MKRRIIAGMCLLVAFMLCSCGKSNELQDNMTGQETIVETKGEQVPETYAVAVVVTINPQVKLYLDANSVIVGVEYLNEDAKAAFSDVDLTNVTMEDGMEKIISAAVEKNYLSDGKDVSIDVAEVKNETSDAVAICKKAETAVIKAAEEKHVTAVVTSKVSVNVAKETQTSTTQETATETQTTQNQPSESVALNPCSNCGGTGKCDECKGDGYRGAGFTVSCPRCHGALTETCIYCDANGNSTKHAGTCDFPNCMGSHIYSCTTCGGGTTAVECASCNGSGKCKVCGGDGAAKN